jgi:hypothetical protein
MLAAVCREMDKPALTSFLECIGFSPRLAQRVSILNEEARRFDETGFRKDSEIRQSAVRLETDSITMLTRLLATASDGEEPSRQLLSAATALGVESQAPAPLLSGRDLMNRGISPGPEMGLLLKAAFNAQLDGAFKTKEEGFLWLSSLKSSSSVV